MITCAVVALCVVVGTAEIHWMAVSVCCSLADSSNTKEKGYVWFIGKKGNPTKKLLLICFFIIYYVILMIGLLANKTLSELMEIL